MSSSTVRQNCSASRASSCRRDAVRGEAGVAQLAHRGIETRRIAGGDDDVRAGPRRGRAAFPKPSPRLPPVINARRP